MGVRQNKFVLWNLIKKWIFSQLVDTYSYVKKLNKMKIFNLFWKWIEKKVSDARIGAEKDFFGGLSLKVNRKEDIDVLTFPPLEWAWKKSIFWSFHEERTISKNITIFHAHLRVKILKRQYLRHYWLSS